MKFTYLVCKIIEAHLGAIVSSSLLGIAHPKANVVKGIEDTDFWLKMTNSPVNYA